MYVTCNECTTFRSTPLELLPLRLRKYFFGIDSDIILEIRLRRSMPLVVTTYDGKFNISSCNRLVDNTNKCVVVSDRDIDEAVDILTNSSLYSYADEIKNGFITAPGGHRVGICGRTSGNGGLITEISGLNYRFAREVAGCADSIADVVYNKGNILSTLIVSSPGCGKTTVLRDLIRQISNRGVNVSVVDERGEIAASCNGVSSFDVGANTDVLSLCNKAAGMKQVLRTMSPRVIAVDEFNVSDEGDIIHEAASCGVSLFATIHCNDWKKDIDKTVLSSFRCIVVLSSDGRPGTVEECIYV